MTNEALFWLLDKGWLALAAVIGLVMWEIRNIRSVLKDRGDVVHEHHARLSVVESRTDALERQRHEDMAEIKSLFLRIDEKLDHKADKGG